MLATVINKNDNIDQKIWSTVQDFCVMRGQSEETLILTVWIAKAILLKGGKDIDIWLDKMVVLASGGSEVAKLAADAWWLLLGDTPDLSEEVSAKIKLLYPQKLFGLALPKIKAVVDGKDKRCAESTKENMLLVLGHLLSLVPSEVQSRELPPLLPLLLEALSAREDGLVDSALSTVMQLQSNGSETVINALVSHLDTLIERFLSICYSQLSLRSGGLTLLL